MTSPTLIDWTKPIQWDDGSGTSMVEGPDRDGDYMVTLNPMAYPAGYPDELKHRHPEDDSGRVWVTPHGEICGTYDCTARIINVPEVKAGGFRLHWEDGFSDTPAHLDFPCLDDALDYAGTIYSLGCMPIRLTNWLGEDACPPEQLIPIAKMRNQERENRLANDLESNPLYGAFG